MDKSRKVHIFQKNKKKDPEGWKHLIGKYGNFHITVNLPSRLVKSTPSGEEFTPG